MVDCDQQRPLHREFFLAHDADISVEPMEGDSGNPSEEVVYHFDGTARLKLSGTLRNSRSASIIPIATVATPVR